MKAAVVRQFGKPLQIEEVAVRRPGNHQVLVKIVASGVCHTDLHATDGDWPVKPQLPLIPGHEGIGYIAAIGPQTVLNRHTIRGSIVGTRKDMQEAVGFALDGKVKATVQTARLEEINSIFDDMKAGRIEGRVVMTM